MLHLDAMSMILITVSKSYIHQSRSQLSHCLVGILFGLLLGTACQDFLEQGVPAGHRGVGGP